MKALYATATPEFWIAAAHANGIYNMDAEFASYAADEKTDLAKKLRHQESSSDEFAHEVEFVLHIHTPEKLTGDLYQERSRKPLAWIHRLTSEKKRVFKRSITNTLVPS